MLCLNLFYLVVVSIWPLKFFLSFIKMLFQKEDKIRILRQRLADRDATTNKTISGQTQIIEKNQTAASTLAIAQGKNNTLQVIQPDQTTTLDFDSAYGGGISSYTRSSRASQSDLEFSESYL